MLQIIELTYTSYEEESLLVHISQGLVTNLIAVVHGREVAYAVAVLGPHVKKHGKTQECWLVLLCMVKYIVH